MSDILNRRYRTSPTVAIRAYAVGLAAMLLASVAWHTLRPSVTRSLARSSVGCEARAKLIAGAIAGLYPRQRVYVSDGEPMLSSYRQGNQGGVCWLISPETTSGERPIAAPGAGVVADLDLNSRGLVHLKTMQLGVAAPPGDWDADGAFEVSSVCIPTGDAFRNPSTYYCYWVVIRLGGKSNEIVGLAGVSHDVRANTLGPLAIWQDKSGDGIANWVFVTARYSVNRQERSPFERLAVFEWSKPGGVLRPRVLPDDGSVLAWTPPDGRPYRFPADKLVDEVCQELLPVPKDLGAPPASQPASAPTSSPAP
jgi:hypothetical protein